MIAPRRERVGLTGAPPLLIVGMAPARSGADSSLQDGTHVKLRLATYAGVDVKTLIERSNFVNLLAEWPGDANGTKWDAKPDFKSWDVGQRAALLWADCSERPRPGGVVGLGRFVRDALSYWWELPKTGWFVPITRPSTFLVMWSPHPAGTNMWWNDLENRAAGESFWRDLVARTRYPLPPRKPKLAERSAWALKLIDRFEANGWPDSCVDWPWVDPQGRPGMYYRGENMPASHVALTVAVGPRPTKEHQALHSCDRGDDCFNAKHLRWGTELENRVDQVERERGTIGKIGLTNAQGIVERHEAFLKEEAARLGVSVSAIRGIVERRSWQKGKWEA